MAGLAALPRSERKNVYNFSLRLMDYQDQEKGLRAQPRHGSGRSLNLPKRQEGQAVRPHVADWIDKSDPVQD